MVDIRGQFGTARVFNDLVEQSAISQIIALMNSSVAKNSKIRIMPDVHAGAGSVIGYTATLTNRISASIVGVDIGCGVCGWNLGDIEIDFSVLDKGIRHLVPSGRNVRDSKYSLKKLNKSEDFKSKIESICNNQNQDFARVMCSIGSLGGGNHFIEIDEDDDGNKWLLIHSGSRNFGLKIANWHQKKAISKMGKMGGLEYLEGDDAIDYFEDMEVAQEYAAINRRVMGRVIIGGILRVDYFEPIESVHNYINFEDKIIRKGAISAHKDEQVIIPLNMADGTIIGVGKGIEDWNYSAPHGAGRTMSRREAKETINLEDFKEKMKDVWTTCVSMHTLDESPMAYKDAETIIEYLKPTVEIKTHMKPVYNFKAKD